MTRARYSHSVALCDLLCFAAVQAVSFLFAVPRLTYSQFFRGEAAGAWFMKGVLKSGETVLGDGYGITSFCLAGNLYTHNGGYVG